jgi:hypothetical protein
MRQRLNSSQREDRQPIVAFWKEDVESMSEVACAEERRPSVAPERRRIYRPGRTDSFEITIGGNRHSWA